MKCKKEGRGETTKGAVELGTIRVERVWNDTPVDTGARAGRRGTRVSREAVMRRTERRKKKNRRSGAGCSTETALPVSGGLRL